jgi:hypothetical protein
MEANLLASGHNLPQRAMTGSGIYQGHGKGQPVMAFESEMTSKLLVATVESQKNNFEKHEKINKTSENDRTSPLTSTSIYQRRSKGQQMGDFNKHEKVNNAKRLNGRDLTFTSDKLENYTALPVPKNLLQGSIGACNNEFCCNLTFSIAEKDTLGFHYQLLVFDGKRTHKEGRYETEMQVCALVACADDSKLSCTSPFSESTYSTTTVFDHIKIEAKFKSDYLWLNTLDSQTILPIERETFSFVVDEDYNAVMEKVGETTSIHTFGIYSHDYIFDY